MLLGLAVIAVPLIVALGDAELQIRALADTGQQLVVEGVTAARASQDLFAQISSLERTARLYQVLNDPKLLDLYRGQDSRLSTTRVELDRQVHTNEAHNTLAELGKLQQRIGQMVLGMPQPSYGLAQLLQSFADLSALADRAAEQSNAQIDSQVVALKEQTLEARRRLLAVGAPLARHAGRDSWACGRCRTSIAAARPGDQRARARLVLQSDQSLGSSRPREARPAAGMAARTLGGSGAGTEPISATYVA